MEGEILQEVQAKKKREMERAKERENKTRELWEALKMSEGLEKMTIGKETTKAKNRTSIPLKELRIVLLGHRGAGKTAAGNTILGSEAFPIKMSVQSIKKEGCIAQRHVTVIRASDWEKEQLLMDTPELTKQELMLSLSMCPPGPHAIVVVVSVLLKFTEASRRAVQEHLELLSEKAWKHCMVLFTCEEWLGDLTIEQYIESEGKPLQWLIEQCGNRYHVLNYKNRKGSSQVPELLQKIEYMVTGYGGIHYQLGSDTISKLENLRKMETERAGERRTAVDKHRQELKAKLKQRN
ncbi:GTPase IMAP family member 8-like [Sardina pilchardus]|uniref:GTPase IMAP family member 8-like n=1 Tax=Sardina pilchardus TaxID=27697 RepID=UPI002E0F9744